MKTGPHSPLLSRSLAGSSLPSSERKLNEGGQKGQELCLQSRTSEVATVTGQAEQREGGDSSGPVPRLLGLLERGRGCPHFGFPELVSISAPCCSCPVCNFLLPPSQYMRKRLSGESPGATGSVGPSLFVLYCCIQVGVHSNFREKKSGLASGM